MEKRPGRKSQVRKDVLVINRSTCESCSFTLESSIRLPFRRSPFGGRGR
jgi:hypothetical protein